MRISRSRVRPSDAGDQQPGGVGAAVDGADRVGPRCGQAVRHPSPYRVVAAGQIPGVMGVQALDAPRVPPTPPDGRGPVQSGGIVGVAFRRVVRRGPPPARPESTAASAARTPPCGFQPVHGGPFGPADQPVAGRHGRAVVE